MIRWTPALKDRFAEMYDCRSASEPVPGSPAGCSCMRVDWPAMACRVRPGIAVMIARSVAPATYPAVAGSRTIFPTRVREASAAPALLTPGAWQRKLGAVVTKGAWKGFPIFALTLEERATCPADCHNWFSCYGNSMQAAWRNRHGDELEEEVGTRACRATGATPWRLRGAFTYPRRLLFRGLLLTAGRHGSTGSRRSIVFGYSARDWLTPIGAAVGALSLRRWDRFAVRLSATEPGILRAVTLHEASDSSRKQPGNNAVITCPAQTGATTGCNTCGLCWSPAARRKTIGFIMHGPMRRGRAT